VTMAFFEDVWSRNFLNFFSTPIHISEYLAGLVTSSIITSFFGLIVMLVVAMMVFGLSFLSYGLLIIPALMILFLFGIALGITGCAAVLRFGPSAEWFIWPIPAVISPFVGVFYPLSTLPAGMRYISGILPPSFVFESIRTIAAKQQLDWSGLIWAGALSLLYLFLSCRIFIGVYRQAVKNGIITRYSAESVS
jgi:ABC-2 type transport system permease protein